jgi:hypothetical protein
MLSDVAATLPVPFDRATLVALEEDDAAMRRAPAVVTRLKFPLPCAYRETASPNSASANTKLIRRWFLMV